MEQPVPERLREVIERGQPVHAEAARQLLDRLRADPRDAEASATAASLVDAYLNDPYLTR